MRDPLPLFPGYALRRAANATAAQLATRLHEVGLKQVDASLLMLIGDNPMVTASALGRQLDIQRANMVPLLKRLGAYGFVDRKALDKKSQGLVLTEKGTETMKQARQIIEDFETELLERIAPEHREHLLPALDALWR